MFAMFSRFFSMLELLFSAGEKGAKSLDVLADAGLDRAIEYRESQRAANAKIAKQLEHQD